MKRYSDCWEAERIEIASMEELERKNVQAFIEENLPDGRYTSILSWPSLSKVFGAKTHGKLAGLILSWKNSFHPHCIYFKIVLEETTGPDGIAEKLLSELARNSASPLQTSIWEEDLHFMQFYESKGLKLIRKTFIPVAAIDSLALKTTVFSNYKVFTLLEISQNKALKYKLAQFTKQIYEETHLANPAVVLEAAAWEKLIYSEDTLLELSCCIVDENDDILAFSYIHEETKTQIELGWVGYSRNNDWELLNLVLQQIIKAKQKGYKSITGEFDSTSTYAMFIYQNLHFPKAVCLNTYQLKKYI